MENSGVFINSSENPAQESDFFSTLLQKAVVGDERAFGDIYNLYFKKIYRFIYFRVSHKELAEDLAEDVFIKAFQKISTVKEHKAFEGWLYQIARNIVIDHYRDKKVLVDLEEVENIIEYESNILDQLLLEDRQKLLLKLLKELPQDQQLVIKFKFLEELENTEISQLLNKTEGAIRVLQHRALQKLQELISKIDNQHNEAD